MPFYFEKHTEKQFCWSIYKFN